MERERDSSAKSCNNCGNGYVLTDQLHAAYISVYRYVTECIVWLPSHDTALIFSFLSSLLFDWVPMAPVI